MELSIVIPLAPNEALSVKLLSLLSQVKSSAEILLVSSEAKTLETAFEKGKQAGITLPMHTILARPSRAYCMNEGAAAATGAQLLFLHADSYFDIEAFERLISCYKSSCGGGVFNEGNISKCEKPTDIFYFELVFHDGPFLMKLNQVGAKFRSHVLKTPFGDQGLCLSKELFKALGGYDVSAPYGEDHLLIRCARAHKIGIKSIGRPIYTSARKYSQNGWLKTTCKHQVMWVLQMVRDSKYNKRR